MPVLAPPHTFCHSFSTRFCNRASTLTRVAAGLLSRGVVTALISMALNATAPAAEWRGIVPLYSEKKTVRATLGTPQFEMEDRMEFASKEGKVVIFFYTAEDTVTLKLSPALAGRVLTIYFYPKDRRRFRRSEIEKQISNKGHGVTIEGERMTSYDDPVKGVSYHFISNNNFVWRIVYYAPRAEFEKFKLGEQGELRAPSPIRLIVQGPGDSSLPGWPRLRTCFAGTPSVPVRVSRTDAHRHT